MGFFAGCRRVELFDKCNDVTFPMAVLYPTSVPAKTVRMEPFDLDVSIDAAPEERKFPLVLVSHGSGGAPLLYRTLALHLARSGFIVGMPEHPYNNWCDNSLAGRAENLIARPRHIQAAIDWFCGKESPFAAVWDNIALIGHSMGGCTALTMAGGVPASSSRETAGQVRNIEVKPDPRIKSLVLLAPMTTHFGTKGALSGVNVPILLIVGDEDKHTPYDPHARMVLDGVPDKSKVCCRVVENAGHFSFLSPFPAHMVKATYPPSQDPSGFDRTRFLDELNAEIGGFLSQTLADAPSSEEIRSE